MTVTTHEITVVAQGRKVPGWHSYSITQDVLQPANDFSLSVRFTREVWDLLDRDVDVSVFLDRTRILQGFIGRREKHSSVDGGSLMTISGRDKTGRLVDTSANLFSYGGLRIKELAEKLVGDLFEDGVKLRNTDNRFLLRNVRARQSRVIAEPITGTGSFLPGTGLAGIIAPEVQRQIGRVRQTGQALVDATTFLPAIGVASALPAAGTAIASVLSAGSNLPRVVKRPPIINPGIFKGRQAPKKVPPGASKWQVLEEVLSEARLMAWSSADGRTLFVGLPNSETQEIQYLFLEPGPNSGPQNRANAKITVIQDVEEMYSAYVAVGASRGNGANYGPAIRKNAAVVYDNPDNPSGSGVGVNFRRPKVLLVQDDGIKNARGALERAEREKLEREVNHWEIVVEVAGHSQIYFGEEPTLYAVDTLCRVMDYSTGIGIDPGLPKDWYITQVIFSESANEPTTTQLRMVPKGTLLVT